LVAPEGALDREGKAISADTLSPAHRLRRGGELAALCRHRREWV